MGKTCTGRCCEYFTIGYTEDTPEELAKKAKQYGGEHKKVYEMLIPLGCIYREKIKPSWYYTCKHYDKEKRICTDYNNRPSLCIKYPNGHKCDHSHGCSYRGEPYVKKKIPT